MRRLLCLCVCVCSLLLSRAHYASGRPFCASPAAIEFEARLDRAPLPAAEGDASFDPQRGGDERDPRNGEGTNQPKHGEDDGPGRHDSQHRHAKDCSDDGCELQHRCGDLRQRCAVEDSGVAGGSQGCGRA